MGYANPGFNSTRTLHLAPLPLQAVGIAALVGLLALRALLAVLVGLPTRTSLVALAAVAHG